MEHNILEYISSSFKNLIGRVAKQIKNADFSCEKGEKMADTTSQNEDFKDNENSVKFLYSDFERNREQLERDLNNLKKKHGRMLFPNITDKDNILDYFIDLICPTGLSQSVFVTNISITEKNKYFLMIRPKPGSPRLEMAMQNICLALNGYPYFHNSAQDYTFTATGISDVSWSEKKDFESEQVIKLSTNNLKPWERRDKNLLEKSFLESLSPISLTTKKKLGDWFSYLKFKENYVRNALYGIRYCSYSFSENKKKITFLCVFKNKEVYKNNKHVLYRYGINSFDLNCSSDAWDFSISNDILRKRAKSYELGRPKNQVVMEMSEIASYIDLDSIECPWEEPCFVNATFMLKNAKDDSSNSKNLNVANIAKMIPTRGFLAPAFLGDLILVDRNRRELSNFARQGGYAPFLSTYIFDIKKARIPVEKITCTNLLNKKLNSDQHNAVNTIINSPDISLIQGPPGTGKTTVIAEAIYQFTKMGKRVLLASQANMAVDNALERLAGVSSIRAIRLGKTNKYEPDFKFANSNVIKNYYTILGENSEKRLDGWKRADANIEEINSHLKNYDLINSNQEKDTEILSKLRLESNNIDGQIKIENQKKEKYGYVLRENECLEQFKRILKDEAIEVTAFESPALIQYVDENIIPKTTQLKKIGISIFNNWITESFQNANSDINSNVIMKSTLLLKNLVKINKLAEYISQINSDIMRLRNSTGDGLMDIEDIQELENLKLQLENHNRQLMDEDLSEEEALLKLNICKKLKKSIAQIKLKTSKLDNDFYNKLFDSSSEAGKENLKILTSVSPGKDKMLKVLNDTKNILDSFHKSWQSSTASFLEFIDARQAENLANSDYEPQKSINLQAKSNMVNAKILEANKRISDLKNKIEKIQKKLGSILPTEVTNSKTSIIEQAKIFLKKAIEEKNANMQDRKLLKGLIEDWVKCLKEPNHADETYVKQQYLESCNVVGITCNASKKQLEELGNKYFDVAIIDEVSKSTPPELILPMMLAKKSVLVGDHRQLPPTFTSYAKNIKNQPVDASESNSAELLSSENFSKYRKMVTASLFKEYFENAPSEIKATLWTQYRMHPQIMNTINKFYENNLICGLEEFEELKKHNLTLGDKNFPYISPEKHAIWVDTSKIPSGNPFYETKVGTTKQNDLEAFTIKKIVKEIEESLEKTNKTKSLAIISFYGGQKKLLINTIRELKLKRLKVKIDSVDRFQGREANFVIVSMVASQRRGRKSPNTFIGQFERINVAFSRAQELLVIVGAKDMFIDQPVKLPNLSSPGTKTRAVYADIIEEIDRNACLVNVNRILTSEEWNKYVEKMKPDNTNTNKRGRR